MVFHLYMTCLLMNAVYAELASFSLGACCKFLKDPGSGMHTVALASYQGFANTPCTKRISTKDNGRAWCHLTPWAFVGKVCSAALLVLLNEFFP